MLNFIRISILPFWFRKERFLYNFVQLTPC